MRYVSFWQKMYRHKTSSEFFLFLLRQHFFICTLPHRRTCTNGIGIAATSHRTYIPEYAHLSTFSYHTSYQVLTQPNGIIQLEEAKKEGKKNCYLSIGFPILVSNYFSFRLFFSTHWQSFISCVRGLWSASHSLRAS